MLHQVPPISAAGSTAASSASYTSVRMRTPRSRATSSSSWRSRGASSARARASPSSHSAWRRRAAATGRFATSQLSLPTGGRREQHSNTTLALLSSEHALATVQGPSLAPPHQPLMRRCLSTPPQCLASSMCRPVSCSYVRPNAPSSVKQAGSAPGRPLCSCTHPRLVYIQRASAHAWRMEDRGCY